MWLYNHFAVGRLGVDDILCGVTWPQLKSVMEAKKTRLTATGMCLPSCRKACKILERVLQSDTEWWCMDFAVHPRIVAVWHSVYEYYVFTVKSLCVTSLNQYGAGGRGEDEKTL